MVWILLLLAGLEEVIATVAMKYIKGFERKKPLVIMVVGFIFSFYCLTIAMKTLPAGVAYAVWTAVGSVGVSVVGVLWFKEKFNLKQFVSLGLILIGVMGLKLTA